MFPDSMLAVWSGIAGTFLLFLMFRFRVTGYFFLFVFLIGIMLGNWVWIGTGPLLFYRLAKAILD